MELLTSKCGICGDVVLSSFLAKHDFFVHGDGANLPDSKVMRPRARHFSSIDPDIADSTTTLTSMAIAFGAVAATAPASIPAEPKQKSSFQDMPSVKNGADVGRKRTKKIRDTAKAAAQKRAKEIKHQETMRKQQFAKKAKKAVKPKNAPSKKVFFGPRPILGRGTGSASMWSGSPSHWVTIVRG